MEQFFSVTRGRSATSTFCTYCGGCSVPRHIYIYIYIYNKLYCIAIIKSNLFRHRISQNDSGVYTIKKKIVCKSKH